MNARRRHHPAALLTLSLAGLALLGGCATPQRARSDADGLLRERSQAMAAPREMNTRYSDSLVAFGRLLEVYRRGSKSPLYVQSRSITDSTGLSHPLVGSELPTDITEMVRSAVNRIGEKVVYVPYQPDYVIAHAQQGARLQLTLPDVLITGAITEFDRALSSAGRGNDIGILFGKGKGETDASHSRKAAATVSRLTLDFNLVDFGTQTMIPRMQAINSMRVLNETYEDSYDFAIYGNGFGLTTSTRYLQGRHNAIRLLVDMSIVQLIGRHTNTPYWRVLPGGKPDPVVTERITRGYASQNQATRVRWMQDTLRDYGFAIEPDGKADARTLAAIESLVQNLKWNKPADAFAPEFFAQVYVHVPVPQLASQAQ